jgi:L-amino acid N-acyltransferase YncA
MQLVTSAPVLEPWHDHLRYKFPERISPLLGAQVIALYNDSIATENVLGYTQPLDPPIGMQVTQRLDESVRRGDKQMMAIMLDERLIGMGLLTPNALPNCRHVVEWSKGIIHSEYRGRGVLQPALYVMAQHCVRRGWDLITLDVRVNSRSHRLWQSFGFEEYGRLQDYARIDGRVEAGAYLHVYATDLASRLSAYAPREETYATCGQA